MIDAADPSSLVDLVDLVRARKSGSLHSEWGPFAQWALQFQLACLKLKNHRADCDAVWGPVGDETPSSRSQRSVHTTRLICCCSIRLQGDNIHTHRGSLIKTQVSLLIPSFSSTNHLCNISTWLCCQRGEEAPQPIKTQKPTTDRTKVESWGDILMQNFHLFYLWYNTHTHTHTLSQALCVNFPSLRQAWFSSIISPPSLPRVINSLCWKQFPSHRWSSIETR